MDNQVQLFSLLMQLFMGHSVKFAFIERENFFHVYPQLINLIFLKFGLCVFIFPTS